MNDVLRMLELYKQIEVDMDELDKVRNRLADEITPYKIGDIIPIQGWVFKGKKGRVIQYYLGKQENNVFTFTVRVQVLKMDGTDSINVAVWHEDDDPKIETALHEDLLRIGKIK